MASKLVKLTLSNFGPFVGEHVVEFHDGLTLVEGPSGAGKSTIFRAVAFCLGYCPLSAKDFQSDFSKEKFQLELTINQDGVVLVISRGKVNSVTVDNVVKTDASSELPKLLAQLVGPPETIEALTYRDQEKAFNFLDLSDTDKKDFVSPLVPGMKAVEAELEWASKVLAEKEAENLALQVQATNAVPENIPPFTREDIEKSYQEIQAKAEAARIDVEAKTAAVNQVYVQLEGVLQEDIRGVKAKIVDRSKLDQISHIIDGYKGHLKDCEAEIQAETAKVMEGYKNQLQSYNQYRNQLTKLGELQTQLTRAEVAGQSLGVGKCPTCSQTISDPKLKEQNTILQEDLRKRISALEAEPPVLKPTQPSYTPSEILQTKKTNLSNKLYELEAKKAEIQASIKSFELKISNEVKGLENQIREAFLQKAAKEQDLRTLYLVEKSSLDEARAVIRESLKKLQEYEKQEAFYQDLKAKLAVAEAEAESWKSYQQLLKGFKAHVFEELLGELADKTNEILSQLDNTSDVSVEFRTVKEQTKGQKDAITPVFTFHGVERPLKTASGGMKLVIKFAVSLAMASVVASRTGIDLGWLMLDETFHSLNHEIRRQCLGILESYSKTKQVVIIDHGADFESLFTQVIKVENKMGQSRISQ